jgi:hypothetical protein
MTPPNVARASSLHSSTAPRSRRSIRRFLRVERRILASKPRPRTIPPPIPEPPGAREILAAIAAVYGPGEAIGIKEAKRAAGRGGERVRAVRNWAIQAGLWPYLPVVREPGWLAAHRRAAARKGGGS